MSIVRSRSGPLTPFIERGEPLGSPPCYKHPTPTELRPVAIFSLSINQGSAALEQTSAKI